MAVTLVKETGAGLSNANAYADLDEGNTYHGARLHNRDWETADDEKREIALVWATRLLDQHARWEGYPVSTTQSLRWPQYGAFTKDGDEEESDAIPTWLRDATCEFALFLLRADLPAEAKNARVTGSSTGRGSKTKDLGGGATTSVIPPSVLAIINHTNRGGTFRIERT